MPQVSQVLHIFQVLTTTGIICITGTTAVTCTVCITVITHLYLLDEVNIIDAQRWFTHQEPPMNFEILLLLVLLVIFSRELIHMFLPLERY